MTASDHSELHSAQPLLSNFDDIPGFDDAAAFQKKTRNQVHVSFRSLEDGSVSDSGSEFGGLRRQPRRPSIWRRLQMSLRRRATARNGDFRSVKLGGDEEKRRQSFRWRRRSCLALPVLAACVFGILYALNFAFGLVPLFWEDATVPSLDWTLPGQSDADTISHLRDITRNVTPIPCHSHNDYWRRVPLYDALRWGCTGVEADVWLFENELFVGHSTNALTQTRTFRTMYVDPLVQMLDLKNSNTSIIDSTDSKNGIFDTVPSQTLVLLVDFKNDGRDIFPYVSAHLSALREKGYLTYFDGKKTHERAITVVATGNAPFDMITANSTYRDIFFDAPLATMYENPSTSSLQARGGQGTVGTLPTSHFDSTNSYYASVNFGRAIGWVWWGRLSSKQLDLVRGQIAGAQTRGLKARYWSTPKWPIGLRNKVWRVLVDEGVGYLNGDDLKSMTRMDWGDRVNHG